MDKFLKHYLTTALWSSNDDEGTPFDRDHEIEDFSEESIEQAKKDCESFKEKAGIILDRYEETSCGHDFWLTRNGHGSGFWDGDYGDEDGEALTKISKEFSNVYIVKGDDGKLYIE